MLQVPDLKTFTLGAGEPFLLEVEFQTSTSARIDVSDREYVMTIYGPERVVADKIDGELNTDEGGSFMRFLRDGTFSESLYGKLGLSVELAERYRNGRDIVATGKLTVVTSAATVASYDNGPIGRQAIRTVVKQNAIPGGLATVSAHVVPYVDQVAPEISLAVLALSTTALTSGTAVTIAITGATDGSTVTGTPPDGMTLDSAGRGISGTPTTAGDYSLILTETLAGAVNSPKLTTIDVTVQPAPVVLPASVNVVFYGDSWFDYDGSMTGNDATRISARAMTALPNGPAYTRVNSGHPGERAQQLDDNYDSYIGAAFDATKAMNILVVEPLINDMSDQPQYGHGNAFNHRRWIITKAKKQGYKVVLATVGSRADGAAFDANALDVTVWDRLYWPAAGADALADVAAYPGFRTAAEVTSGGLYQSDKLHPTVNGNDIYGRLILAPVLSEVISSTAPLLPVAAAWSQVDHAATINLSGDGRTVTVASGFGNLGAYAAPELRTGKAYWEMAVDNITNFEHVGISSRAVKQYTSTGNSSSLYDTDAAISVGLDGNIANRNIGTAGSIGGALAAGDVLCFALNATADRLWVRKLGGLWNGSASADPATGAGGIDLSSVRAVDQSITGPLSGYTPAAVLYAVPAQVTSRLARSEQTGPIPSGFGELS